MANIKDFTPITDWIEFKLQTAFLDPPVLRVKLRMLSELDTVDAYGGGARKVSAFAVARAMAAIAEWDLMDNGKPVPCNDEEKAKREHYFRVLMAQLVEGSTPDAPKFLSVEICRVAQDQTTFLKN